MDLTNVQGNIVPGFNKAHQALVLVGFSTRAGGQRWLQSVLGGITSAADVFAFREARRDAAQPDPTLIPWTNVAFTWQGLQVLLGPSGVAGLPRVFSNNQVPFCDGLAGVHALLHIAADDAETLEAELQQRQAAFSGFGVTQLRVFNGQTLGTGGEHFGFRDGVSTVVIDGVSTSSARNGTHGVERETPLAAGEFFFGEPDGLGRRTLPGPEWTRGGTFMAFMQLEQDVPGFRAATQRAAQQLGLTPAQVAERMVGRTVDGEVVGTGDPLRLLHIGRARPQWVAGVDRHRIIRRGIPYGALSVTDTEESERGLLFICYQADLERQFEQVWKVWLNDGQFPGQGSQRDGLVGQPVAAGNGSRDAFLSRGAATAGVDRLTVPQFVMPRYGGYFMVPSMAGLQYLASA